MIVCTAIVLIVLAYIVHLLDNISNQIRRSRSSLMSASQDAVNEITAQVSKGTAEVVAQVAALEAQVAAGEAPDLTALKAAAQALDDLNADPVVEEPVEEPVEETPEA